MSTKGTSKEKPLTDDEKRISKLEESVDMIIEQAVNKQGFNEIMSNWQLKIENLELRVKLLEPREPRD